ncbi:MAG TPA: hypothetical protein VL443_21785 [Cyclobacteriaceae bacterium]|jgi:hypothetical protein|nr:hypothetical protein [Cyclobacteriaceae bacterium]
MKNAATSIAIYVVRKAEGNFNISGLNSPCLSIDEFTLTALNTKI